MRAILSVYDKSGIVDLGKGLCELGWELYSTGGTEKSLAEAGLPVTSISDLTGAPEILGGRVKTLHPKVHGGILAKRDHAKHRKELADQQIKTIELVAVNLYPFEATVARPDVKSQEVLENIDIGGPTMIRAAAKNFPFVTVLVDPEDYAQVLEELRAGKVEDATRARLAQKAFQQTASYDTVIARYFQTEFQQDLMAPRLSVSMTKMKELRYGENPHQKAAFYASDIPGHPGGEGFASAEQLWGKELSYNNILDADAAWTAAADFDEQTAVVVKHTNPCGIASGPDQADAYQRAYEGDSVSAFGGIVAINRPVTLATAERIGEIFYEIVIAPDFEPDALERLKAKKNLRLLKMSDSGWRPPRNYRQVLGGFLVQTPDATEEPVELKVVTKRQPGEQELADLRFAWRAARHVKSNAIVLAGNKTMHGMGAGQPNRVVSVALAAEKAGAKAAGSVLASDAFFPFGDSVEQAAAHGVTAIIQPGGSIRDDESIEAADKHGLAMVFTGIRHFKH